MRRARQRALRLRRVLPVQGGIGGAGLRPGLSARCRAVLPRSAAVVNVVAIGNHFSGGCDGGPGWVVAPAARRQWPRLIAGSPFAAGGPAVAAASRRGCAASLCWRGRLRAAGRDMPLQPRPGWGCLQQDLSRRVGVRARPSERRDRVRDGMLWPRRLRLRLGCLRVRRGVVGHCLRESVRLQARRLRRDFRRLRVPERVGRVRVRPGLPQGTRRHRLQRLWALYRLCDGRGDGPVRVQLRPERLCLRRRDLRHGLLWPRAVHGGGQVRV